MSIFKIFHKRQEGPCKTCLMIGGSGMAAVWIKNFIENFTHQVKIVGLCDVNTKVLEKNAKLLGLSKDRLFTDFNEACEKVKADFCGIAIPPQFHSSAAIAAMENGMPVLCEKPIADTLEAAKAMLHTSKKTDMPCAIIQQFRYASNKQEFIRIRDEGRLGRLQYIVGKYADDYQRFTSDKRPHRRLLFHDCVHHFDMFRFLSGSDCETLSGFGWKPEWSKFDHWSSGFYIMRMENGLHAFYEGNSSGAGLITNWHSYYRAEFENGTVELLDENRVVIYQMGKKTRSYKAPKVIFPGRSGQPIGGFWGHVYIIDEFLNWLDGGLPSSTRIEDNIKSFVMSIAARDTTLDNQPKKIRDYLLDVEYLISDSKHKVNIQDSVQL